MKNRALLVVPVAVLGALAGAGTTALAATSSSHSRSVGTTTVYVSTTGSDSNPCTYSQPCATIQYAIDNAPAGALIKVAAGSYNQSVHITKPLTLSGAGASTTTIDGSNIDTGANGYYGVVAINNTSGTAGTIAVHGFTIDNAFVTQNESNSSESPVDVFVNDANAGDTVRVSSVTLGAVQDNNDFGGIGLDTLNAQSAVYLTASTITGNFQGALLEGASGPETLSGDTFTALAACGCGGGNYAPEGVFVLSDAAGSETATVNNNKFTNYAGDGTDAEAGYSGGNCAPPNGPCTGSLTLTANGNLYTLGGAAGSAAIYLISNSGNSLTATLNNDHGTVTSPTVGIHQVSHGGLLDVTENNDNIKQS